MRRTLSIELSEDQERQLQEIAEWYRGRGLIEPTEEKLLRALLLVAIQTEREKIRELTKRQ